MSSISSSSMRSKPSAETTLGVDAAPPTNSGVAKLTVERRSEAGEPTGAREHVCGPGVILTASVKGAREGARVKIMPVGCPQTAGRASRSGAGLSRR